MASRLRKLIITAMCMLLGAVLLAGCGTIHKKSDNPRDPYEHRNRQVYRFNRGLDDMILRPAANFYNAMLPYRVRKSITNFFDNLEEPIVALNDILQGEFKDARVAVTRFLINSTLGIAGLIDVASHAGIPKHYEDFGLTFAKWGDKNSPYWVNPFLGPSTIRDSFGITYNLIALYFYPKFIYPGKTRYVAATLYVISHRADLEEAQKLVEKAALDPYAFERDAFLQRRTFLMNNGKMPEDTKTGDKKSSGDDDLFIEGEDEELLDTDEKTEEKDDTSTTKMLESKKQTKIKDSVRFKIPCEEQVSKLIADCKKS